jgi:tetrapyrrole methylase family protein/MazG family protein/ATP diphosphatase
MKKTAEHFVELMKLIQTLRGPNGCPWDKKQTPEDVKAYLVEELYEILEAIDMDEKNMLMEEIGDMLFMILFLVNLYEEKKAFTLNDALKSIQRKMIHRHPHVFGSETVSSAEKVKTIWQLLKEKEGKKPKKSFLDGIPANLPALSRAFFLTSKASEVDFDWQTPEEVLKKVKEEIEELETALPEKKEQKMADEIGDIIFGIVNLSRHLGIEPEQALRRSNKKFVSRFEHIETVLQKKGKSLKEATLDEMDKIWEEAKNLNR